MNILFILTNYPGVGGIEKVTTLLANEFSKRGNNVYIVSVNAIEGSANIEELSEKVIIFNFPNTKDYSSDNNALFLNNIISEYKITSVIFQDCYTKLTYLLGKISKVNRRKIKLLVSEHNDPLCTLRPIVFHLRTIDNTYIKLKTIYRLIIAFNQLVKQHLYAYIKCDNYVLLSERFNRNLKISTLGRSKKAIAIHNPLTIPIENIESTKKNEVLFVGRFVQEKGLFFLINIWRKIFNKTNWELRLVGDGPLRKEIENYIKDNNINNIFLEGYKHDVTPYMNDAKIIVITSFFEGWGLVISEAMSRGCVPIGFDSYASIHDLITKDTGILIKAFDIDAFSSSLLKLMSNEEHMKQLSEECIKYSISNFRIEKIVEQWNKILK